MNRERRPPRLRLDAGDRFGPYRILERLALGGMAAVYKATREDDAAAQPVALKVLLPAGPHRKSLERCFDSEREIHGTLDHPNVVQLHEGGATPDGRLFLVMEYVDGMPIDEHCDRHRLTVAQRLELFRQVCGVVHYAHQQDVVHRDVKPGNILVTGDSVPKIIDFGIAHAQPSAEASGTGLWPMTPHYASPEQLGGRKVTTVSDVYSLGVLLYKLMTDRLPYDFSGLRPQEMEAVLHRTEPARPSAAVAAGGEATLSRIAEDRSTSAHQLRRQLAGNVDNIVMMALRKEPEHRYGSATELAEDLRRHLETIRPAWSRGGSWR